MLRWFYGWLDSIDPYYTQRIIFMKNIYGLVIFTYVNWLIKPTPFVALFACGLLLAGIYDSSLFKTFRDKDNVLVRVFLTCAFVASLFYLTFPRPFIFIITVLAVFASLYILTHFYLPAYRVFVVVVFNCCLVINNSFPPHASIQMVINICAVIGLSLLVILFIHKTFPNQYDKVMKRSLIKYIEALELKLNNLQNYGLATDLYRQTLNELTTISSYQRLVKKKLKTSYYRIFIYSRNIFMALTAFNLEQSRREDISQLQTLLTELKDSMRANQPVVMEGKLSVSGFDANYIAKNIRRAIYSWNNICKK